MVTLPYEKFEQLVAEGVEAIPNRFRRRLENVAIVIEDEPSPTQLRRQRLTNPRSLFGLYEGVPKARRGAGYSGVLPDKITIFKRSIEYAAARPDDVRRLVRDTVWHEIAHHFGLGESRVRRAEAKRRIKH